nr:cell envelope integrity protein TolA [Gilliamella apicola]
MSSKLNSKLSLSFIISIILHGLLIFILAYQFVPNDNGQNYGNINGNSIDAVMIDPSVMTEDFQRQLQSQINQKKEEQLRQAKELAEKTAAEKAAAEKAAAEKAAAEKAAAEKAAAEKAAAEKAAAEKAAAEKAAAEKAAAEKAAAEKAAAEKAAAEKAAAEKAAAEKAAAEKAAAEKAAAEKAAAEKAAAEKAAAEKAAAEKAAAEKAAAEKAAAEKAAAEKAAAEKAAAEKAAAAKKAALAKKAEQAKKDKALDDLLGGLISSSPSTSGGSASRKGVSDGELNKYKSLVQNAISNKFVNPPNVYHGKTCELQIQIAPDGLLLNVIQKGGDADLCREALAATKLAIIPKPASNLYSEVKTMNIDFQPQ